MPALFISSRVTKKLLSLTWMKALAKIVHSVFSILLALFITITCVCQATPDYHAYPQKKYVTALSAVMLPPAVQKDNSKSNEQSDLSFGRPVYVDNLDMLENKNATVVELLTNPYSRNVFYVIVFTHAP